MTATITPEQAQRAMERIIADMKSSAEVALHREIHTVERFIKQSALRSAAQPEPLDDERIDLIPALKAMRARTESGDDHCTLTAAIAALEGVAQPEPHGVRMSAAKKDAEDHEKWKEGWDAAMNWCEVNDLIKDDVVIPKYTPAPEPADGGTPGWIGGRVRPLPDSRIGLTLGDTEHVLTHTQAVAIATRLFAASPAAMETTEGG